MTVLGVPPVRGLAQAPRLLLGAHFSATTADRLAFGAAFSGEGGNTAVLLREALLPDMAEAGGAAFYSFPRAVVQRALASPDEHGVLIEVLARLHVAHGRMEEAEGAEDWQLCYWLQLFIDTHADLCAAMHRAGVYDDAALRAQDKNPETVATPLLAQWAPRDLGVPAHAGDLPDLTPCLDYGKMWYQVGLKPRVRNIAAALVHLVASKTQMHKCQLRNFVRILHRNAVDYPEILTVFRGIVLVALLGNWPHATQRPPFGARLQILRAFRPDVTGDREFFLWIDENDQIVFHALKEFHVFLVSRNHMALDVVMAETTHWAHIKQHIAATMDGMRSALAIAFDPDPDAPAGHQKSVMAGIAADLRAAHDAALPFVTKLRKAPFPEMVQQEMQKVFNRRVLDPNLARPQSSMLALAAIDGTPATRETVRDMQLVIAHRFPDRRTAEPVDLGWLGCFGVSADARAELRQLYFEAECRDIADNHITRRLTALFERSRRDFFAAHLFFQLLGDHRGLAEFALPREMAAAQAAALRAKHRTPPWEALPAHAGVFHYCPSCQRWLNPVVARTRAKNKKPHEYMFAIGRDNALYSSATGLFYCGKQNISSGARNEIDLHPPAEYLDNKRDAARIRNFLSTPLCCTIPARGVEMVGKCKRLGGKLWALCEVCGAITQWEGAKFGPLGFTCGYHAVLRPDDDDDADIAIVDGPALAAQARVCTYCKNVLARDDPGRRLLVLDDTVKDPDDAEKRVEPTWRFEEHLLCYKDTPGAGALPRAATAGAAAAAAATRGVRATLVGGPLDPGNVAVRKSVLYAAIARRREKRLMGQMSNRPRWKRPG